MKIAFCGDSFCASIGKDPFPSYPYLIAKEFDAKILCSGQNGGCLFYSYERMMENIEDADYIIFCVTDSSRLANRYNISVGAQNLQRDGDMNILVDSLLLSDGEEKKMEMNYLGRKTAERFKEGICLYYETLMSLEFHEVAHRGILREIDDVIKQHKKKCIFLKNFEKSFEGYEIQNALYGNLALDRFIPPTVSVNHLNEKSNRNLANIIIDVIREGDFTPREIDMNNRGLTL
jgi:hypothetical protein